MQSAGTTSSDEVKRTSKCNLLEAALKDNLFYEQLKKKVKVCRHNKSKVFKAETGLFSFTLSGWMENKLQHLLYVVSAGGVSQSELTKAKKKQHGINKLLPKSDC